MGTSVCKKNNEMIEIIPLPDDAIIINGQYDINVDFTVSQLWQDAEALAIKYTNIELDSSCYVEGDDVSIEAKFNFKSKCVNSMTDTTIVVYYDSDFDVDDCEACNVEDISNLGGHY